MGCASDYSIEDNKVDFDAQARQLRAQERIIIQRERVRKTRHLVNNCRNKVQKLRDDVQNTIHELTRTINEQKAFNLDPWDRIKPLYEKLGLAQDQLGPAEDEYDTLERRLDEEENDCDEEEDYFYRHYVFNNKSLPKAKSTLTELSQPVDSEPTGLLFAPHNLCYDDKIICVEDKGDSVNKWLLQLLEEAALNDTQEDINGGLKGTRNQALYQDITLLSSQMHEQLEEYYEALQTTRNDYGLVEDEVAQLEDALYAAEFGMARMEEHIYTMSSRPTGTLKTIRGVLENLVRGAALHKSKKWTGELVLDILNSTLPEQLRPTLDKTANVQLSPGPFLKFLTRYIRLVGAGVVSTFPLLLLTGVNGATIPSETPVNLALNPIPSSGPTAGEVTSSLTIVAVGIVVWRCIKNSPNRRPYLVISLLVVAWTYSTLIANNAGLWPVYSLWLCNLLVGMILVRDEVLDLKLGLSYGISVVLVGSLLNGVLSSVTDTHFFKYLPHAIILSLILSGGILRCAKVMFASLSTRARARLVSGLPEPFRHVVGHVELPIQDIERGAEIPSSRALGIGQDYRDSVRGMHL